MSLIGLEEDNENAFLNRGSAVHKTYKSSGLQTHKLLTYRN